MANYAKINALLQTATQADYNQAKVHAVEKETTTWTNEIIEQTITAATTGTTLDLGHLSSTVNVLIENTDASNTLWVKTWSERASITFASGDLTFAAGPPGTITIAAGAEDWTAAANTFKTHAVARVTGCTDQTANNTDFDIQAVSATALTAFEAETVTAQALEAGTVTVKCIVPSWLQVPAGQVVALTSVTPADDIVLTAITAAIIAKVSYIGVAA